MSKAAKAAVAQTVKILIGAGKAAPAPPVGPALGQRGLKTMDFCKAFNSRTEKFTPGVPIPTKIYVEPNRTFTFVTTLPPASYLLKQAAGIEKGSGRAGEVSAGEISVKHIYEIAKIKAADPAFEQVSLESIARQILGSARSCGITVVY
ncbi:hypothetical protein HK097_007275 [Rhizophlyctis rosea]|uniref:Large ribosomal subunit protein uL11m n=1 Tax=Rhizophlyctis rosea TaxID=64517 RepID=A0AAD5X2C5_9FUNG|nr:hypothetical protein HK097_007275 [Rhizophlyctis rosea]